MRMQLLPLSDVLAKKAAAELNERPNDVPHYLDALRAWLMAQPHLRSRTQDQFLIAFLRGSKFSLEKCKQKIDNFYTCRGWMPELFKNRDANDPKVYEVLRLGSLLPLPKPVADDGPRVIMLRLGFIDFHRFTCIDVFKVGTMIADLCLYEDNNALVAGYVVIVDVASVTPFHLFHFDPIFAKKLTVIGNKASPSRLKGFHFINMLPAYEKCFNMVKGAINEKLRSRFYFHGNDMESLFKYVPKHCLPAEYGGTSETIQDIIEYWEHKIKRNKDFFIEEDSFGCDEKLRKGKKVTADSLFGIEGTFRQLTVD